MKEQQGKSSDWPRLSRAPAVEALIDIRVKQSVPVSLQVLKAAAELLSEEFPARQELRQFSGEVVLHSTEGPRLDSHHHECQGFILRSADGKTVAQFRVDGFALSRLLPYTSWTELRATTSRLWSVYRDAVRPTSISRVAVRFINRIPIAPGTSLEKSFRTTFVLPESLPQQIAGFLLRVVIPIEVPRSMAILSQTLEHSRARTRCRMSFGYGMAPSPGGPAPATPTVTGAGAGAHPVGGRLCIASI